MSGSVEERRPHVPWSGRGPCHPSEHVALPGSCFIFGFLDSSFLFMHSAANIVSLGGHDRLPWTGDSDNKHGFLRVPTGGWEVQAQGMGRLVSCEDCFLA